MKGSLHEAYAGSPFLVCAIHHSLHQLTANAGVLQLGIDGDRADAVYDSLLGEHVAAHDSAIAFGYDGIEARRGKHHRKQSDRYLWSRKIAGKSMSCTDRGEGVVANLPTRR